MSEMIRRVARALADVPPNHPAWTDKDLKDARYWDAAIRAIAAMLEPSEPMVTAMRMFQAGNNQSILRACGSSELARR